MVKRVRLWGTAPVSPRVEHNLQQRLQTELDALSRAHDTEMKQQRMSVSDQMDKTAKAEQQLRTESRKVGEREQTITVIKQENADLKAHHRAELQTKETTVQELHRQFNEQNRELKLANERARKMETANAKLHSDLGKVIGGLQGTGKPSLRQLTTMIWSLMFHKGIEITRQKQQLASHLSAVRNGTYVSS